jgi:hypothetical protein
MLQTSTANRPHIPTLAEIEQRRAELHRLAGRRQPKPLRQPPEPPPQPPPQPKIDPISAKQSPHPAPRPECPQPVLAEAALQGLAGLVVGTIAIRRIFHGHLEASRIDAALEKLLALGALSVSSQPTTGRSSTLWSATQEKHRMEMEESLEDDEPAEDE